MSATLRRASRRPDVYLGRRRRRRWRRREGRVKVLINKSAGNVLKRPSIRREKGIVRAAETKSVFHGE